MNPIHNLNRNCHYSVAAALAFTTAGAWAADGDWLPAAVFPLGANTSEADLSTPYGMSVGAGAGARGFVDDDVNDAIDTAGAWNARFLFGSRKIIGLEAAYLGSAGTLDALGLDSDARLLGTGVEGALRLHFLPGMWQPYVMAGAGWSHYRVTNEDYNTSSIGDSDDMASFPMGAGLAFHYDRLVLDLRGVYRPTAGAEMIPSAGNNLDSWAADFSGGFEF